MGGSFDSYPPGYGYPLAGVYLIWAGIVGFMYVLCRPFAAWKDRGRAWWSSYL